MPRYWVLWQQLRRQNGKTYQMKRVRAEQIKK